jgi:hypothetical protein
LLLYLNMRGMKESIRFLLPIFIGFVLTHTVLIMYGVTDHGDRLPGMVTETITQTWQLGGDLGWVAVAALLLRAYSLGGGTYTGIEAVSNNVQSLAEPRVATGKWTMFYMALSLAFTAAGIIILYLLWDARHVDGRTLNAVTFEAIIASFGWETSWLNGGTLIVVLAFEAGLLLVAANTGSRRAGGSCEHGRRFLDAASVSQSFEPAGHSERCDPHGDCRRGGTVDHDRQCVRAGRSLQHQCIPDFFTLARRPGPLLGATSGGRALEGASHAIPCRFCRVRRHPGGDDHRKIH